VQTAHNKR